MPTPGLLNWILSWFSKFILRLHLRVPAAVSAKLPFCKVHCNRLVPALWYQIPIDQATREELDSLRVPRLPGQLSTIELRRITVEVMLKDRMKK